MKLRASRRLDGVERTLIRQIFDDAPADAINLGLGEPDLPTPPVVALAGVAGIADGRTGYTSTAGDPLLRRAIAERYRPFAAGPENVLVTIGSQEAMFVACAALADPGDEILYPDPGYPAYPVVARLLGAIPVPYPLEAQAGFRLRAGDVESRITERTRAVILCSPSNPTGACIERSELETLTSVLRRRNVPWLSDEIYSALTYDRPHVSASELCADGGLVISSLSKEMSMTGWRIGWIVGAAEFLTKVIAAHQYLVTCAPSVSQCAAVAAFSAAGIAERRRYLETFRVRREVTAKALAAIPHLRFERPEGAFYYFVDVSHYGDALELSRRILENKVITIPGVAFGPRGDGFLRISFAASRAEIREGLRRIGETLAAG